MAAAGKEPAFLIKKLGGVVLLLLGLLIAGVGFSDRSIALIILGVLLLLAGLGLLMAKIVRRNQL